MNVAAGTVELTDKDGVDVDALAAWLRDRGVFVGANVGAGDVVVSRFPAGHSNLTYLVDGPGKSVVLRAPPPGAANSTMITCVSLIGRPTPTTGSPGRFTVISGAVSVMP